MTALDATRRSGEDAPEDYQISNTISVDIGGTFTDCFVYYDGRAVWGKSLTTRHRLDAGFNAAIQACASQLDMNAADLVADTDIIRYATTLAMNALIERKGPRLGLLTTAGFEDTIFIGRGAQWHDGLPLEAKRKTARGDRPPAVIPRHMVVGLRERIDDDGQIVIPLQADDVRAQVRKLVDQGAMGFVVALMQAHRNAVHEEAVRDLILEEYPEVYLGSQPVLLSSEVLPQQAEYQRDMSTILAAYLHRTMAEELTELGNTLHERGYKRPLYIASSGGGSEPLQRTSAVDTYNAGPVAGVIGGAHLGKLFGIDNVIVTDMGGTSFDIGTIVDLELPGSSSAGLSGRHFYANTPMIERFRVGISMIETKSIGAGGGSIARYNKHLEILEVGPESAGSNPGPACFGLGGTEATVTDADVVLGLIDPDYFLGGQMKLDREAAFESVRRVAEPLGTSTEDAAFLIKSLTDAKMGNEIFKETNLKGYDPKDFVMFAFGGGGATHACGYGKRAGVKRIMTFPFSSVFSAFGIANTDFRAGYDSAAYVKVYDAPRDAWTTDFESFNAPVRDLQSQGLRDVEDLNVREVFWSLELHMKYGVQPHLTRVRAPKLFLETPDDVTALYEAFETEYSRIYSKSATYLPGGVEIAGMTLWSAVPTRKVSLPEHEFEGPSADHALKSPRPTYWGPGVGWVDTPVYELELLRPGNELKGPAVIEAPDTTIVIDATHNFSMDSRGCGSIMERR